MDGEQRYGREGFGATAASNSTRVCYLCGAVVYDVVVHDAFHDRLDVLSRTIRAALETADE